MVHVLWENNLGYRTGCFGEIKTVVEDAFQLAVASFKFFQEHRDKLIRDQRTRFRRPISREIWDAIFAKVKRSGKKVEPNKYILGAKSKQVQQHNHDWPSLYQGWNHPDEPIVEEAILGELDGVVDIIVYYLSQLHDADDRKKTNFNR